MKKRELLLISVWAILALLMRALKFSLPIGNHSAVFSCFVAILPMLVYFFPSRLYLVIGLWFFTHILHPIPLTLGIPTLLAALSWKASHKNNLSNLAMHVFLPMLAMVLFVISPNGKEAWPYALYWLIPVICVFGRANLFKRTLQSTFTAHAAGSIIWAYLTPLTSAYWLALIPVVAIERLISVLFTMTVIGILSELYTASVANEPRRKNLEESIKQII